MMQLLINMNKKLANKALKGIIRKVLNEEYGEPYDEVKKSASFVAELVKRGHITQEMANTFLNYLRQHGNDAGGTAIHEFLDFAVCVAK